MVITREARLSRGTTRYLEAGSGAAVVLLHAFPLTADMWRDQLDATVPGHRLVAPDLRGFGPGSSRPAQTMDDMADGVVELLDALRIDSAIVGGLSLGGYVTFALLRRAPSRVRGLVLADTRATADTEAGRAARVKMLETLKHGGVTAVADEMLPKLLGETTRRRRPGLADQVRTLIETNRAETVAGAIDAMRTRPDSTSLLAAVSVPTLILCGDEDVLTPPADARAMQEQIAGSRVVMIPGAGHLSNIEAPDRFSAALGDFLHSVS